MNEATQDERVSLTLSLIFLFALRVLDEFKQRSERRGESCSVLTLSLLFLG